MMGIVVPETCWAYKKYNKWLLVCFYSSVITMIHTPTNIKFTKPTVYTEDTIDIRRHKATRNSYMYDLQAHNTRCIRDKNIENTNFVRSSTYHNLWLNAI